MIPAGILYGIILKNYSIQPQYLQAAKKEWGTLITISLCMIVKDEADILHRCLTSVADLMDEIIIVDTGSTDNTKEIAAEFTDQIYDFVWQEDFSAARNFAFSKASMEYIYSADADEVIDPENHLRFFLLKQAMMPEIEIVQMHYITPPAFNTTANYQKEYRPKLYKRLREFVWIDAVHETVRLDPVVYDSDIEIQHLPKNLHSSRDFRLFRRIFQREGQLSAKLHSMYVKELFVSGDASDFNDAAEVFHSVLKQKTASIDMQKEAICALCHIHRLAGHTDQFFSLAFQLMPDAICSELCYEIGIYFSDRREDEEAVQWFTMAAYHTEAIIDARRGGLLPLLALEQCYRRIAGHLQDAADPEGAAQYLEAAEAVEKEAAVWQLPSSSPV